MQSTVAEVNWSVVVLHNDVFSFIILWCSPFNQQQHPLQVHWLAGWQTLTHQPHILLSHLDLQLFPHHQTRVCSLALNLWWATWGDQGNWGAHFCHAIELLYLSLLTCHDPLLALARPIQTKVPLAFLSFLDSCFNHELHYLVWVPKRLVGHGISCAIEAAPHTTWQHPHCGLPNSRFWASYEACQGRSSTRWGQDSKHQFCTNSPFPCLCQESCLNPIDRMLCSKASAHEFCLLFLVFRRCLINLGWTG